MKIHHALLLILLVFGFSACQQQGAGQISTLRLLEEPDAADPAFDFIAAYAGKTKNDVELRFDLLGTSGSDGYDLYLAVDTGTGKTTRPAYPLDTTIAWDLLLIYPAHGLPRAITADGAPTNIRPRSLRGAISDSFRARISKTTLGANWEQAKYQAIITRPGSPVVEDRIGPFGLATPVNNKQAALAFAFWDTLPSATPAQALRRWDGAHTGPFGQRHGLKILLEAARAARRPVILLDLKQPDQLAALEVLGGLSLVQQMQQENLLVLPEMSFGDAQGAAQSQAASNLAAQQFGLQKSSLYYGTAPQELHEVNRAVFARLRDPGHLLTWNKHLVIPLPAGLAGEADEASQDGLSVTARKTLLRAALSANSDELVVFGGSLPGSPWGDLLIAAAAFSDIGAHPWIRVLDQNGLLAFPARVGMPDCADLLCLAEPGKEGSTLRQDVETALNNAPNNLFRQLAWQAFLRLNAPTQDQRLAELRAGYLGQVGPLIAAAHWYDQREPVTSCAEDLDWDGQSECILASKKYFFVIDPNGGRLVFAAAEGENGAMQLVGQRSQFVVGLGDPFEWKPELGAAADPEDIPGGFADDINHWQEYQVDLQDGKISLTQAESGWRKTYQIADSGLQVTLQGTQPIHALLPIVLLDQANPTPGALASYRVMGTKNQLTLTTKQARINLVSSPGASIKWSGFQPGLPFLTKAEDPNFGYPAGHYIPFPITILELYAQDRLELSISTD